jgi:hypothetical protein
MREKNLTQARLKEVLRYDQQSGQFFWIVRGAYRRNPGDAAGSPSKDGRIRIRIDGELFYRYRLAWLYMTGYWPTKNIDHINGDQTDDRWVNLRDVSQSENLQNQRCAPKHSSTGLIGAQRGRNGKFSSSIQLHKKHKFLGTFATPEEAHAAYIKAKRELHPASTI